MGFPTNRHTMRQQDKDARPMQRLRTASPKEVEGKQGWSQNLSGTFCIFLKRGDVRSLHLPGTYKQKIGYLGSGLAHFERLKSLNLSHNSLVSVEGLQHLKHLKILNLYYNCIPSLEEVKVLFELPVLRELDLRLNPLSKTDRYYRPFLVHAMAGLRKLDGCPVKDDERKNAKKEYSQQRNRDNRQALLDRLSNKISLLADTDDVDLNHAAANYRRHCYSSQQQPGADPLPQTENKQKDSYRKPLGELLDLMDKHWVGERTLQLNTNFLTLIVQILSLMENHISSQDAEVKNLKEEVGVLCHFAAARQRKHKADVNKLTADLAELNTQMWAALEENVALRKELLTSERMYRQYMTEHPPTCHNIEAKRRVAELNEEVEKLKRKVMVAQSTNEHPQECD
ncbi:centrosomal protein of 72 kDa [Vanacampus margaritifer]